MGKALPPRGVREMMGRRGNALGEAVRIHLESQAHVKATEACAIDRNRIEQNNIGQRQRRSREKDTDARRC